MSKSTEQKTTRNSTNKPKNKATEKKAHTFPVWGWGLIVIAVIVLGYLIIRSLDKKEPVVSNLPLEINVDEAANIDQKDWFILDVRESSEWEEAHIPYATLIPLGELTSRLTEIPKDKNIVVVCRSGKRSAVGRDLLLKSGFANVTSMAGGMSAWQNKGYPIVAGP